MPWRSSYDRVYWQTFYDLPTGWSALVSDDSQAIAPRQPTSYTISASSRLLHISWPETFTNLEEAQRQSLQMAMTLPRAPETNEEAKEQFEKYSPMALKGSR